MNACYFDGSIRVIQLKKPQRQKNDALIRVKKAGICNTDHEIIRGYVPGFNGIPGHEFIGTVEDADNAHLIGKRCTAEINCACGACSFCMKGLERHCPNRTVLGIINRNGAFAQYICVPLNTLIMIPDSIPDNKAIFIEPLAAALEILDQITIHNKSEVLILGDGKLALLCGFVLSTTNCSLTMVGKHENKLQLMAGFGVNTKMAHTFSRGKFDIVVEATGNPSALKVALDSVKPRGTVVLKSTYAGSININFSSIVVDEITLIGSRCGLFSGAIEFIKKYNPPLENLISREMPLLQTVEAFEYSSKPEIIKVILTMQ